MSRLSVAWAEDVLGGPEGKLQLGRRKEDAARKEIPAPALGSHTR